MKPYKIFYCTMVIALIFFSGCAIPRAKPLKVNYYTLEYESPKITALSKLPVSLRMDRFQIFPEYDTDKLVVRKKDFQRNHYNYEKWRSNPKDLATYFLNRDLQQSGLFQGVFPPESLYKTSHLITGTVDAFYEKDGEPWKAVLGITVILLKQDEPDVTKRVLFQKSYFLETSCADKTPRAFVSAMSQAMALVSNDMTRDLHRILSEPPQPQP
ncbi:MAG: PqiC family protein [Proteobacteria bacterium]|nr:PqiC family protein [Pseudomonadota bacterium]